MTGGTFDYDCPAPSFRKQGGFTSYHNGTNIIFFVIKKRYFQAQKLGAPKSENHSLNFLKEGHLRKRKSSFKIFKGTS